MRMSHLLLSVLLASLTAGCASEEMESADDESSAATGTTPGALDPSFGSKGRLTSVRLGLLHGEVDFGVYLRDGSMLLGGSGIDTGSTKRQAHLFKLKGDGSVDTSFGTKGDLVLRFPDLLRLHPRGKSGFWATTRAVSSVETLAYDEHGNIVELAELAGADEVLIDKDGRAIVRSCTEVPYQKVAERGYASCEIKRLDQDGKRDSLFAPATVLERFGKSTLFLGGNGVLLRQNTLRGDLFLGEKGGEPKVLPEAPRFPQEHTSPCSFAIDARGALYVASSRVKGDLVVSKYGSDWSRDRSFGNDGVMTVPWRPFPHNGRGPLDCITTDAKGRVLVVAITDSLMGETKLGVARILASGSFDKTFDGDGRINIKGDAFTWFSPLALQVSPTGRIATFGFNNDLLNDGGRVEAFGVLP